MSTVEFKTEFATPIRLNGDAFDDGSLVVRIGDDEAVEVVVDPAEFASNIAEAMGWDVPELIQKIIAFKESNQ